MSSSNTVRRQLENKLGFSNVSTKVNRPISEFNTELLNKLRANVETLLKRLVTANGNQFEFEFSELQRTTDLSFKIRKGFIPTSQMSIIKRNFKGARIPSVSGSSSNETQELLIPKTLCEAVSQFPESYEDVDYFDNDYNSDDEEDDENTDAGRKRLLSNKAVVKKIYREMGVLAVIMVLILLYFYWIVYNIIKKHLF